MRLAPAPETQEERVPTVPPEGIAPEQVPTTQTVPPPTAPPATTPAP